MGLLEDSLDEDKNYRTFMFGDKPEDRRKVEVPLDDLIMIFKGFRPRLMDLEDFKQISHLLQWEAKNHCKGTITHLSKVSNEVWKDYTKDAKHKVKQRGSTYVKDSK
jgi:hypothetical protein